MKTASLGLLEVRVVRVNAGAPPDPPSVGDVTGPSPFLCFLKIIFLAKSGIIFLARALELQETTSNKRRA